MEETSDFNYHSPIHHLPIFPSIEPSTHLFIQSPAHSPVYLSPTLPLPTHPSIHLPSLQPSVIYSPSQLPIQPLIRLSVSTPLPILPPDPLRIHLSAHPLIHSCICLPTHLLLYSVHVPTSFIYPADSVIHALIDSTSHQPARAPNLPACHQPQLIYLFPVRTGGSWKRSEESAECIGAWAVACGAGLRWKCGGEPGAKMRVQEWEAETRKGRGSGAFFLGVKRTNGRMGSPHR